MNHEVSTVLERAINVPGASFTRNSMLIDGDANPKQLKLQGDFIQAVTSAADWWRADWCAHVQKAEVAEERGIEQKSFEFYLSVTDMFPADARMEGLTFEHHAEAMLGSGRDAKRAHDWLAKAIENNWSVSQMRKAIREANAEYRKDKRAATGNGYTFMLDAERWCRVQLKEVSHYTPERAAAVLGDLSHLRKMLAELERIAARLGEQ